MFFSPMGINQKTTWSVRSGPAIYCGMSIPDLKNTQGAGAGKLLISHLCKDDNVGQVNLMFLCLANLILFFGMAILKSGLAD
jgi:hypothetical protein